MDYVKDIRADEIIVQCEFPALQRELGLAGALVGSVAVVPFRDRSELARLLTWLQALDVPFLDGGPDWTPASVFQSMRQEGLYLSSTSLECASFCSSLGIFQFFH